MSDRWYIEWVGSDGTHQRSDEIGDVFAVQSLKKKMDGAWPGRAHEIVKVETPVKPEGHSRHARRR